MIPELNRIKKITDIINCEGPILALHQSGAKLYLVSNLTTGKGLVYYSTTKDQVLRYLNSEITLKQVYLESEDFIVKLKLRSEVTSCLKEDFTELITYGAKFYKEIANSGMTDENILEVVNGI